MLLLTPYAEEKAKRSLDKQVRAEYKANSAFGLDLSDWRV